MTTKKLNKMKYSDIKILSVDELSDTLRSEKDLLSKLKFAHTISPIENPMKIKEVRKLIARLKTELTVKEAQ